MTADINRIKRYINELKYEQERADFKNFSWTELDNIREHLNKALAVFDDHRVEEV